MTSLPLSYRGYRFSPEIIGRAVGGIIALGLQSGRLVVPYCTDVVVAQKE
jgi:hypothetical protein